MQTEPPVPSAEGRTERVMEKGWAWTEMERLGAGAMMNTMDKRMRWAGDMS